MSEEKKQIYMADKNSFLCCLAMDDSTEQRNK